MGFGSGLSCETPFLPFLNYFWILSLGHLWAPFGVVGYPFNSVWALGFQLGSLGFFFGRPDGKNGDQQVFISILSQNMCDYV